jgi:hypothetical protein
VEFSWCISDFVVFHVFKVGLAFTSHSKPMRHPFRNNAPHIKLCGASLLNCLVWTVWEWRSPHVIWLHWFLCVFHPWFRQRNPIVLRHTDIGRVIEEQWGYAVETTNERYMSQKLNNMRQSPFLGVFRTYPS